jgi:hypothetical protein
VRVEALEPEAHRLFMQAQRGGDGWDAPALAGQPDDASALDQAGCFGA